MIGLACAYDSPVTSLAFSILIGQSNKVLSFTFSSGNVNKGNILFTGTFQKFSTSPGGGVDSDRIRIR